MIPAALKRVNFYLVIAGCVCLLFILGYTLVDVVGRKFGHPLPSAIELCGSLVVAIVCLSMAQVQAEKRNISVNVISERFHPRIQATIDTCGLLMMLLVGVLFVRYGFSFTVNSFQRGDIIEGINIPQFIFKAFFIVGGFLLMLQAVFDITDAAKHLLRK